MHSPYDRLILVVRLKWKKAFSLKDDIKCDDERRELMSDAYLFAENLAIQSFFDKHYKIDPLLEFSDMPELEKAYLSKYQELTKHYLKVLVRSDENKYITSYYIAMPTNDKCLRQ